MRMWTLLLAMAAAGSGLAGAQDSGTPAPRYRIKQDEPSTGTHIPRTIVRDSALPFDKSYEELTPEQQALVKSEYDNIAAGDEPPFPRHGLGPIYKAIAAAQQKLGIEGDLTLFVEIDAAGRATSVSVLRSPDPQMTRVAASILMLQDYKPAVCAGQPCRMQYPLRIKLSSRVF